MKVETVKKRLKKEFNYDYKDGDEYAGIFIGNQVLTFYVSSNNAKGFNVSRVDDVSNPYTDYSSGTFAANFKQAMQWLKEY